MNDECIQVLEQINNDAVKIQSVCQLAIDPSDNRTNPDIQTILYIISDYANQIKSASSKIITN